MGRLAGAAFKPTGGLALAAGKLEFAMSYLLNLATFVWQAIAART
jgi:hypothetical protein